MKKKFLKNLVLSKILHIFAIEGDIPTQLTRDEKVPPMAQLVYRCKQRQRRSRIVVDGLVAYHEFSPIGQKR